MVTAVPDSRGGGKTVSGIPGEVRGPCGPFRCLGEKRKTGHWLVLEQRPLTSCCSST